MPGTSIQLLRMPPESQCLTSATFNPPTDRHIPTPPGSGAVRRGGRGERVPSVRVGRPQHQHQFRRLRQGRRRRRGGRGVPPVEGVLLRGDGVRERLRGDGHDFMVSLGRVRGRRGGREREGAVVVICREDGLWERLPRNKRNGIWWTELLSQYKFIAKIYGKTLLVVVVRRQAQAVRMCGYLCKIRGVLRFQQWARGAS